MRILTISDHFPPHHLGGYELACAEVMTRLAERGHQVKVLSSNYRKPGVGRGETVSFPVDRSLQHQIMPRPDPFAKPWPLRYQALVTEAAASRIVARAIRTFRPDIISLWRLRDLPFNVLAASLRGGDPVVFAVSDTWMEETRQDLWSWSYLWETGGRGNWKSSAKRFVESVVRSSLAETRIRFDAIQNVHFFSEFLQKGWESDGLRPRSSIVIHHGVNLSTYRFKETPGQEAKRILFVGRLHPAKGVHVLIDSIDVLASQFEVRDVELHIIGDHLTSEFRHSLEVQIQRLGLGDRVRLLGPRTRQQTAQAYASYDLFVFPSIWEEPFSISLVEAMACGLPVVATNTGGTPEIVRDGQSGLLVAPDDPRATACALFRLMSDHALRTRLREEGRRLVEQMCDLEGTLNRIESFYLQCAGVSSGSRDNGDTRC